MHDTLFLVLSNLWHFTTTKLIDYVNITWSIIHACRYSYVHELYLCQLLAYSLQHINQPELESFGTMHRSRQYIISKVVVEIYSVWKIGVLFEKDCCAQLCLVYFTIVLSFTVCKTGGLLWHNNHVNALINAMTFNPCGVITKKVLLNTCNGDTMALKLFKQRNFIICTCMISVHYSVQIQIRLDMSE